MIKLTLVVPCFNEEKSLPKLIKSISKLNSNIDFLIVENGSTDDSKIYLKKVENNLNSNIKILYLDKNDGYGNGIYKGLRSITNSDFVGWIHGDLQFEFEKINILYKKLNGISENQQEIFYKGIRKGRSFSEKFFSYFMGIFASLILKMKFTEINAQPTIFSKNLMKEFYLPPKDFSFDTYVYWLAMKNNYSIIRDEFLFPQREYGLSNWNFGLGSRIRFSINLIKYFFKLRKKQNN